MTTQAKFHKYLRHTMPFKKWLPVKNPTHLEAIKKAIDDRYGWPYFYIELNTQHDEYRKREV